MGARGYHLLIVVLFGGGRKCTRAELRTTVSSCSFLFVVSCNAGKEGSLLRLCSLLGAKISVAYAVLKRCG